MRTTKIVVIGAGSASFGPGILLDAVHCAALRGSTLVLVDLDPAKLATITALARRINEEMGAGLIIESTTDRRAALPGAEFVVTAIAVKRNILWRQDYEIPLKYGFKQVLGENGGPGGVFHTLRNVPLMLAIAHDMEALCPQALLLNYTNPESRICLAVSRYTGIRAVGLCHGIFMGMGTVSHITGVPLDDLDVQAAGLNHFLWMTAAHRKSTGEDLYPLVRERLDTLPADYLPLSVGLCKRFGMFPFPSDDHVGEYLGFAWPACLHHGYDFDGADRNNRAAWEHIERMVAGESPIDEYAQRTSGESAFDIVAAMLTGVPFRAPAVNIPNGCCIANLPADAVVEVPALVNADGIHGLNMGSLPEPIAALCRTQVAIQSLVVEAAVTGCRDTALQALLLDPVVTDMAAAKACLDELLALQAEFLPQFAKSIA